MTQEKKTLPHTLTLNERTLLTMTGVTEVLSFDETTVLMRTDLGILQIQGQNLKLKELSQQAGEMAIEGTVSALQYAQAGKGGWLGRLLG